MKNFNFFDLQKNEGRQVHWINIDARGPLLFSYDLKTIYNYFGDYPNNLTFDQKKVFDMENPELAY
ncbi:MAG: hypothetical protein K6G75_08965 [Lachnospiraceae bacterium]|nr:hypothetical protein [Lachnospiraceae bacterium]